VAEIVLWLSVALFGLVSLLLPFYIHLYWEYR
jgi:hypothetical protein